MSVVAEAMQGRGHGLGAELLHAAQRHAQMRRAGRSDIDDAAELAEPDDPLAREVPDLRNPARFGSRPVDVAVMLIQAFSVRSPPVLARGQGSEAKPPTIAP